MTNSSFDQEYVCPDCSAKNRANAKFCRQCGQSRKSTIASLEVADQKVCSTCATHIRTTDLFCVTCGERQTPPPVKLKDKTCHSCGKQLPAAANFCTICGTNVATSGKIAPPANPAPNLQL